MKGHGPLQQSMANKHLQKHPVAVISSAVQNMADRHQGYQLAAGFHTDHGSLPVIPWNATAKKNKKFTRNKIVKHEFILILMIIKLR